MGRVKILRKRVRSRTLMKSTYRNFNLDDEGNFNMFNNFIETAEFCYTSYCNYLCKINRLGHNLKIVFLSRLG